VPVVQLIKIQQHQQQTINMSKRPTRSSKGGDSITKNDHLSALMKQQAAMMKQQAALAKQQAALAKKQAALAKEMEEINESIKGLVMEETTSMRGESQIVLDSPLIRVKHEEEAVVDLTSPSPKVKVEDNATPDDTKVKLEDVEVENVCTHTTVASNIFTTHNVARSNEVEEEEDEVHEELLRRTADPLPLKGGEPWQGFSPKKTRSMMRNKKSQKMSPIQSMRQALKTIPSNRLLSPLRRESTDSRHTPPKANSTLRDADPIWLAAENTTIGDLMHPVVKAKLSNIPIDGQPSESDNCIYHLKLYRRHDNGRRQLVMYAPASGQVKLNVMIASMYNLEFTIVRRKLKDVGVISFISMVRTGVLEQFKLRVNRNDVYKLYLKLVELGAHEKITA